MKNQTTILALLAAMALSVSLTAPVLAKGDHEGGHGADGVAAHCDTDAHEEGEHADCSDHSEDHMDGDGHDDHHNSADHHDNDDDGEDDHGHSDTSHH